MPRTKGGKNKPKITTDFTSQIAEKQESIASLTAEITSITANIDTLKVDLKKKKTALKSAQKELTKLFVGCGIRSLQSGRSHCCKATSVTESLP